MLQGTNQIQSKISELISRTENEILIFGSEKDFLKLYHADFLEPISKAKINFKLLASFSEKTGYIFDEVDRNNVRKISKEINDKLCFIIKDDNEILFFICLPARDLLWGDVFYFLSLRILDFRSLHQDP